MQFLYKICSTAEWAGAGMTGVFTGSPIDHADGVIHLSTARQVRETARRHFARREDLILVALPGESLKGLKWEPARGGGLFPHVYGAIPVSAARWVRPLPLKDGAHVFPAEIPQ
ncbi:MAG: DUF952 domain-containing protein [Rhizobiales bacterium]|nr:DUF952 domain-containing protein [Hyphomicrobiales bacterium]